MANPSSVADFSAPPEHWRLFKEGAVPVKVLPPRPPSGEYDLFGRPHGIVTDSSSSSQAQVPPGKLDKDERLYDPEASLKQELHRLHSSLLVSSADMLQCMTANPEEHDRHVRHIRRLLQNLNELLQEARARECKALVLKRLKEQVGRKQAFVAEATAILPDLEKSVKSIDLVPTRGVQSNLEIDGKRPVENSAQPTKRPRLKQIKEIK